MRAYPDLKFLGLALTNANSFDELTHHSDSKTFHTSLSSPSLINLQRNSEKCTFKELRLKELNITGESTESQIISSLKHYKSRPTYLQKALYNLFILTRNFDVTKADLVQIVIEVMHSNIKSQSIQLAATTCVYNLTKHNLYLNLPQQLLTQLINTILVVMLNYPNTLIVINLIYYSKFLSNLLKICRLSLLDNNL